MITVNRLQKLLNEHDSSWQQVQDPGFISFVRTHPDGRRQCVKFFSWSNAKHADAVGIPRSYIVACPGLDLSTEHLFEDARLRIPAVVWPAAPEDQLKRTWDEVRAEIEQVLLPILDAPVGQGYAELEDLPVRNRLA